MVPYLPSSQDMMQDRQYNTRFVDLVLRCKFHSTLERIGCGALNRCKRALLAAKGLGIDGPFPSWDVAQAMG